MSAPQPEEYLFRKDPVALEGLIRRALALAGPTQSAAKLAELQVSLAYALMHQRRLVDAREVAHSALNNRPGYDQALWCDAQIAMFLDDWPAAWQKLEARWLVEYTGPRTIPPEKIWDGSTPLAGRAVLLAGEGRMGDQIQFARFASALKTAGAGRVTVTALPAVVPLFRFLSGVDEVVSTPAQRRIPVAYDLGVPMMTAPFILGTIPRAMGATVPYISAPPEQTAEAARTIAAQGAALNVGVCWRSAHSVKCLRLELFRPLAELPGVRLFAIGERADIEPEISGFPIVNLGATDLLTTAGAIAALDLVIVVDTMAAHLAGALARPAWILLNHVPDWRWGIEEETTPFYPTMRLFRRGQSSDWESVIARVATELRAL
jgi:hypothetical protein